MAELMLQHMHEDIETMKRDLAIIKHILVEEGELTVETKQRLEMARKTPLSKYEEL